MEPLVDIVLWEMIPSWKQSSLDEEEVKKMPAATAALLLVRFPNPLAFGIPIASEAGNLTSSKGAPKPNFKQSN